VYTYDVQRTPLQTWLSEVRVHFQNATPADTKALSEKFTQAEALWNSNAVELDFPYRFHFQAVPTAKQAHFSVQLLDSTRGPYDQFWARDWRARTIAHELGHMLGLGDEYQTLSGEVDCLPASLMCDNNRGLPMKHHYYFILRRLLSNEVFTHGIFFRLLP